MNELRALFSTAIALMAIAVLAAALPKDDSGALPSPSIPPLTAAAALPLSSHATSTPRTHLVKKPVAAVASSSTESPVARAIATRVSEAYETPPLAFETINTDARAALVNIFCTPHGGSLNPISGSGVLIDPRGVVLTNAHVAQYVLLSETPLVDLTCNVRMGAPAYPRFTPQVLAISHEWVVEHASEINSHKRAGTGEHDWALLRLLPLSTNPAPLPPALPYLTPDTRPAIGFVDDQVLAAGYPAEFVGGSIVQANLFPVSSISPIQQLLTFSSGSVDLISLGSVIEAQGGSSGGPVVNQWDKLIGIITTTSDGTTTADRSLRAVTLDYIDTDVTRETGQTLASLLSADLDTLRTSFTSTEREFVAPFIRALAR